MNDAPKKITIRVKLHKINCDENITSMNETELIHLAEQKAVNKTQKKKKLICPTSKAKLWDIFDTDKKQIDGGPHDNMECLYSSGEKDACSVCNSHLVIMEDGFPTCTNPACCIMYKDILDYSPEWRFYGAEDKNASDPTRCGNPINPLLVESSFGCKVLCNNRSSYEMKKIRKWTEWQSMPHKEKSLYDEFQFITNMAQNSGIPRIFIDDAMVLHKDISEQKMFRGMNRDGIKAASIYISCRLNGCPRTAHEIAEIFKLDKTSATNGCSMAVNILHNIERNMDPSQKTDLCVTLPSSFIDRYCSRMNFNQEMTMLAKFVTNKIEKNNIITDNIPHAIAAGVVFFVSQIYGLNANKVDIKNISGVSEVTINKCFKKLDSMREILIPKCILDKQA
jgi:transcription initiation factor TFIIB